MSQAVATGGAPIIRSDALKVAAQKEPEGTGLLAALLREQQTLSAVESFARKHEAETLPAQERFYRDLLPHEGPGPGQQYAFEVDLDNCTGCKACVSACHSLNGLDETEAWRSVGLLHGGSAQTPALQTVTTSCHHCVEPACMHGCPVKAYEKDATTGIVKHLDDQCIGCQYCTFMCPYDAPKYNARQGIVRKCDMCSHRIEEGEAPACVQACPNGAIKITVVEKEKMVSVSTEDSFLAGAPDPAATAPTTIYKGAQNLPENMLPADHHSMNTEHAHPPLVVMLTLTQLAAGAVAVNFVLERLFGLSVGSATTQTAVAMGLCLLALGASVFHLGRPMGAWKAFLGLRTSWMSREILAFGAFAKLGVAYAAALILPRFVDVPFAPLVETALPYLHGAAALFGLVGVFCSVQIYAATKRRYWSFVQTATKFFLTTAILGLATVLTVGVVVEHDQPVTGGAVKTLVVIMVAASVVKLLFEGSVFRHLGGETTNVFARAAQMLATVMRTQTLARFGLGLVGGVFIPLIALAELDYRDGRLPSMLAVSAVVLTLVITTAGELLERYAFFAAAPASRMPGGLR